MLSIGSLSFATLRGEAKSEAVAFPAARPIVQPATRLPTNAHVAANELNLRSTAYFQIRIDCRAKVLRITQRHVGTVDIEKELREREAIELRASADRKVAAAERARELFNLRLVRIEQHYSLKIRQRNSLIAEID